MAQIISRYPASVLAINCSVRVVCPVRVLTGERMFADVAASRVDFDIHCRLCVNWLAKFVITDDVASYRYIHGWLGATIDCIPEGCVFSFGGSATAACANTYSGVITIYESVLSLIVCDLRTGSSDIGFCK